MKITPILIEPADFVIGLADGDNSYDLRNDFQWTRFECNRNHLSVLFKAATSGDHYPSAIKLIFKNCIIVGWNFEFKELDNIQAFTFYILYRDRILQSGVMLDELPDGKKLYRIAFDAGQIEFYSDSAFAVII